MPADPCRRPSLSQAKSSIAGDVIARADFGWEAARTIGEFEGRIKYRQLLCPGETPEDVVYAEKLREDAIRDQGWQVVRWTCSDLRRPDVIRDRVLRAFERNCATRAAAWTREG